MSAPSLHVNPDREIVTTIVIRRPPQAAGVGERLLSGEFQSMGRQEAERTLAAAPQDLEVVRRFAAEHGLHVVSENAAARTMRVEGTIRQMEEAFGVSMHQRRDGAGHEYLSYDGDIALPQSLQDVVETVLGLDRRPVARSHA
ncbi:MAG TPA: protease pro-enzyme activation domain-containing protein [Bryobacteraceae bacterium]|nr:protease pro-enzyme activation domain-containing protein [Bryobacteraceae bacterium]